jgi:hypothetical protein
VLTTLDQAPVEDKNGKDTYVGCSSPSVQQGLSYSTRSLRSWRRLALGYGRNWRPVPRRGGPAGNICERAALGRPKTGSRTRSSSYSGTPGSQLHCYRPTARRTQAQAKGRSSPSALTHLSCSTCDIARPLASALSQQVRSEDRLTRCLASRPGCGNSSR